MIEPLWPSCPGSTKPPCCCCPLGETDAAQVLRHMGPKEVQRVGVAMAQMRNVHREQVEQVMSEFVEIVGDQTSLGVGSDSYI